MSRLPFEIYPVGMLAANCYMVPSVLDENTLYIIDPGDEAQALLEHVRAFGRTRYVILLTHAHVDHIGAVGALFRELPAEYVWLHAADRELYASEDNNLLPYVATAKNLPETVNVLDATAAKEWEILETPGHTQGGVCFWFKSYNALFCGDTLFAGTVGRTDLPGGNFSQLMKSIRETLFVLPEDLNVYPGHECATTIGREKSTNPMM